MSELEMAFPSQSLGSDGLPYSEAYMGMSLRDWFASQALAANLNFGPVLSAADQAMHCYNMADAMMLAREA